MNTVMLVVLGSAIGGMARYGLSSTIAERFQVPFPWGTLTVNVIGCLAIGLLFGWTGTAELFVRAPATHQLATYGFLGGFTTFSTFSLEVMNLAKDGRRREAVAYTTATTLVGLAAVVLGFWITA